MGATPIRSTFFAMALTGIAIQTSHAASAVDFSEVVEQVSPAVVRVNVTKKLSDEEILQQQMPELLKRFFGNNIQIPQQRRSPVEQNSYGTAFFITTDGYLLTNYHVIDDARKVTVTLNDRREVDAEVVGIDPRTDVAVLKVDGGRYPALKIGDSTGLKVGEPVLAIGSPFGFDFSASAGIVSSKARNVSDENATPFIQSDVALNPGNSGGPLFNRLGQVVGINSRIFSGTGGYMGLSFSIPIDIAVDVFDQIRKNGKVSRAYLGIYPQDIDRNLADLYKLSKPSGALIAQVTENTPASRAGIQEGDIVLSFDGRPVTRSADLINYINRSRPNAVVPIVVQRDGQKVSMTATLASAPDDAANKQSTLSQQGPQLGLDVRELTGEERARLPMSGVFVSAVRPNSLASRSHLLPSDVIIKINNQLTPNVASYIDVLKSLPTDSIVKVFVMRNGVPKILGLRIDKS